MAVSFPPVRLSSLPAWGVWIEMFEELNEQYVGLSLPAWGVWIEMPQPLYSGRISSSLPAWGVWIEIDDDKKALMEAIYVAPRMGSVD